MISWDIIILRPLGIGSPTGRRLRLCVAQINIA